MESFLKGHSFSDIVGFDWDDDNLYDIKAEQVFFNHPLIVKRDVKPVALGRTSHARLLFVSFIIRANKIRVISARDMTNKEVRVYEEYQKRNS